MHTAERADGRAGAADLGERYLWALHAVLRNHGVESDVITSGYRPRLRLHLVVEDLYPNAGFEDNVVAAPGADGCWLLWWPWAEQIADADDPVKAAEVICGPLRDDPGTEDAPGEGAARQGRGDDRDTREGFLYGKAGTASQDARAPDAADMDSVTTS